MSKLGFILVLLSAPFFLETSFEMYVLTVLTGPQMLGFSLAHSGGAIIVLLLVPSALSFLLLGVYSLAAFCLVCRRRATGRNETIFAWIFVVQAIHLTLLLLYDSWSPLFSRAG